MDDVPERDLQPGSFQESNGRAALLDALELRIEQLHCSHNSRRAVVAYSDRDDYSSRLGQHHIFRLLEETDVRVDAVDTRSQANLGMVRADEDIAGPSLLSGL